MLCLRIKFFLAVYGIWPLIHQFLDFFYPNILSQLLSLPLSLFVLLYGKKNLQQRVSALAVFCRGNVLTGRAPNSVTTVGKALSANVTNRKELTALEHRSWVKLTSLL